MIAPLFLDAASGLPALLVWAIDTLIVTTLLVLLVIAARKPVARHFGPQIAYLLWAIPAARLILPPLPQWLPSLASPTASPADSSVLVIDATAAAAPTMVQQIASYVPASWPWLLLALWLGGALVTLAWQTMIHRRLLAALETGDLIDRVGRIRVYVSDAVAGPVSFGLLDPVIVLPSHHILPLTPPEQRLAIAHELAHHQRGDLWANAFAVIFAALHWFNPLVRTAWRNFRFDQEAACDACVLATTGRAERGTYARTLAKAASGHASAFASPMVAPDRLKERLAMMIQPDHSKARRRIGMMLAGTVLVGTLVATATPVLADPTAPPVPAVPSAPPAPAEAVASTTIDISNDRGTHVTRIRRQDGSTVILRTAHALSEREIADMVRDAERSRAAAERDQARWEADHRRETGRMRAHDGERADAWDKEHIVGSARVSERDADRTRRDAARSRADAVRSRADAERSRDDGIRSRADAERVGAEAERIRADGYREARRAMRRANRATVSDCRGREASGQSRNDDEDSNPHPVAICRNDSPALQLEVMRQTRRVLIEAMDHTAPVALQRASELADLDREIGDLEREIADRNN